VHYEQDGPVVLITIDRPERMNAIGSRTHAELVEAWTRFRDDDEALVAVLTGAGDRAFSAGGDLKASFLEGEPTVSLDPDERGAHARGEREGHLGPSHWTDLHKPTIAAETASPTPAGSSGCAGRTWRSPTPTRRSG
jgi:enoyl-CoA hydratase